MRHWRTAEIIAVGSELLTPHRVDTNSRFITERQSKIAVINAGYADGVVRARTNRGCALVRERRVPLVGTISMDLTTLDVTDVPGVALGDVVTIYGKDGKSAIEVSDVAPPVSFWKVRARLVSDLISIWNDPPELTTVALTPAIASMLAATSSRLPPAV